MAAVEAEGVAVVAVNRLPTTECFGLLICEMGKSYGAASCLRARRPRLWFTNGMALSMWRWL